MKKLVVLLCLFAMVAVFSCSTASNKSNIVDYQIVFDKKYYEDDKIKVNYVLGSRIFYLAIENKTRNEIILDVTRLALISYGGEVCLIAPDSKLTAIPPRAKVVFASSAPAILDSFDQGNDPGSRARDWQDYKQFIGKRLRLYFSLFVFNTTQQFDIELKIVDIAPVSFAAIERYWE
ncbi:MAG: hypothetical protein JW904_02745 [Spirochaetales bacterium]|nr:hypothetical protein [Spirochaetales bacterium]